MKIQLKVVDGRNNFSRELFSSAARNAMDVGIPEAQPGLPRLLGIVSIDGKPVVVLEGTGWSMGDRRAQEVRSLTDEEATLPRSRILTGYGGFCGGLSWTPVGWMIIGHKMKIVTNNEAVAWYKSAAVNDDVTLESLREMARGT